VAKALAKLTISVAVLTAVMWFGTASSRAYGDAPWCAVTDVGRGVTWDCRYRTIEACVPNVIAGNRGFCNLNPWPGPSQLVPYRHQKGYSPY
jgi:hypothetical protein